MRHSGCSWGRRRRGGSGWGVGKMEGGGELASHHSIETGVGVRSIRLYLADRRLVSISFVGITVLRQ